MPRIFLVFSSADTANANVSGVPAVARIVRDAHVVNESLKVQNKVFIAMPDNHLICEWSSREIRRLAPHVEYMVVPTSELTARDDDIYVAGEWMLTGDIMTVTSKLQSGGPPPVGGSKKLETIFDLYTAEGHKGLTHQMRRANHLIMRNTGKPTDGIVSRYINRPISTRISYLLLRYRSIRPFHATAATGLVALLMLACLLSGNQLGLIGGALLFQAASLLDGVDGEIARATFRSSALGASLDSLTDAITNLGFISGLSVSLWLLGEDSALILGLSGFLCLGLGLLMLGRHAAVTGAPLHFDGIKHFLKRYPTQISTWLIWLTMRDFLALLGAFMVIFGLGYYFLFLFALGTSVWVIFAGLVVLWPRS